MLKNRAFRNCQEQKGRPLEFITATNNKYDNKPIKFLDKKINYELIFTSSFQLADQERPLYNDLLLDLKDADKSKQLHIWINSQGGSVSTLMLLQSLIEQFEYVITIGTGEIDSAGFMLWCLGDERYLYSKTCCMYHSMSSGNCGKTQQLKQFGDYMLKFQQMFQSIILQKEILTKEEVEKGRFTQIWFTGKQLIQRNKAIDLSEYKLRQTMTKIQGFKMDNLFYVKDTEGKYYQSVLVSDGKTKRQLMKEYLDELKDNQQKSNDIIDKVGQDFVNFIQNWIKLKSRILKKDGFITNDQLVMAYQGMYQPLSLEELKNKLKTWCGLVNLTYSGNITKNKKKGFVIQLQEQKQEEEID